jgi:nitrogen fixation protein FixH
MDRTLTGRHVLAGFVAFFGLVIGVNVTMAVLAGRSWTGLLTDNVYVASQRYDDVLAAERQTQALGLTLAVTDAGGRLSFALEGAAPAALVSVRAERPVGEHEDRAVDLVRTAASTWTAREKLPHGAWNLTLVVAAGGTDHVLRRRVAIAGTEEGQ